LSQLQPFEGSRDADVAHGENEFETPALGASSGDQPDPDLASMPPSTPPPEAMFCIADPPVPNIVATAKGDPGTRIISHQNASCACWA